MLYDLDQFLRILKKSTMQQRRKIIFNRGAPISRAHVRAFKLLLIGASLSEPHLDVFHS